MSTALASRRRVGLSSGRRNEMSGATSDDRGMCRRGLVDDLMLATLAYPVGS
jgi:hypothetical protein